MVALSTSQLSSKGQIVIPEEIRNRLGLRKGSRFVVYAHGNVVMLKLIEAPTSADFDQLLRQARQAAKKSGLKRADISRAIKKVRAERKAGR